MKVPNKVRRRFHAWKFPVAARRGNEAYVAVVVLVALHKSALKLIFSCGTKLSNIRDDTLHSSSKADHDGESQQIFNYKLGGVGKRSSCTCAQCIWYQ